jgi:hypothetical protein
MSESLVNQEYPKIPDSGSIEAQANFEGNDALLLIERVNDPTIRSQIIEMLYQNEMAEAEHIRGLTFTPFSFPDMPDTKCFKDQDGMVYTSNSPDYNPKDFRPRTKEEISSDLDVSIGQAVEKTDIDFSDNEPNRDCMPLNWKMPWSGERPTEKQMSIIEAHEKGHSIREYGKLREYFSRGFDPSKIEYTNKDFEIDIQVRKKDGETEELTFEKMKDESVEYLFSGPEIAERMSQLKNYFGISASEIFTKYHLQYARLHYVHDTGTDNRMRQFFQAITSETEGAFLELINSSGI